MYCVAIGFFLFVSRLGGRDRWTIAGFQFVDRSIIGELLCYKCVIVLCQYYNTPSKDTQLPNLWIPQTGLLFELARNEDRMESC